MKAYVINRFGKSDVFELVHLPIPKINNDEVLIKVHATSVNPVDYKFRRGDAPGAVHPFPAILHFDVSGVITAVGSNVADFKVGDEVYGLAGGINERQGCLAEYVAAPAELINLKPKNQPFIDSAAIPLVSLTAYEAIIKAANVKSKDKVLIHGGAGSVANAAIKLAKWRGACVFATVSNSEKGEVAKAAGADEYINYREEDVIAYTDRCTGKEGFDVVFDTVGGKTFDDSILATAIRGRLVSILGRESHDLSAASRKGITISFVNVTLPLTTMNRKWRNEQQQALTEITQLIEKGIFSVNLDKNRFDMNDIEQISKAHELIESGKNVGKVCLGW